MTRSPTSARSALAALALCSFVVAAAVTAAGCGSLPGAEDEKKALFAEWMAGTWTGRAETETSGGEGLDVRVVVLPIWTSRWDSPWLYVEQALSARPEQPYRQRVYHVRHDDKGNLFCDVYDLPKEARNVTGVWREREPFADVRPEDLVPRRGCSLRLESVVGAFLGTTEPRACRSDFRGAKWASYELNVTPDRLETWERGFDTEGRQVWGPADGPDIFARDSSGPPKE